MELKQLGLKHFEAFMKVAFAGHVWPEFKEIVAKSETKYDDLALAAIEKSLVEAIEKAIDKIHQPKAE